jgi:hypothetical protein
MIDLITVPLHRKHHQATHPRRLLKTWTKQVLSSTTDNDNKKKYSNNNKDNDKDNVDLEHVMGGSSINRDIREVVVSIASNIDSLEDYKIFHQEGD